MRKFSSQSSSGIRIGLFCLIVAAIPQPVEQVSTFSRDEDRYRKPETWKLAPASSPRLGPAFEPGARCGLGATQCLKIHFLTEFALFGIGALFSLIWSGTMLPPPKGRIMIDPNSKLGRELKAAEDLFALARTAASPFIRRYYQRVGERYLSSQGELRSLVNQNSLSGFH